MDPAGWKDFPVDARPAARRGDPPAGPTPARVKVGLCEVENQVAGEPPLPRETPMSSSSAPKVLLAQGDTAARRELLSVLEGAGYRVTQAGDRQEGLAALRDAEPPDLVLLDAALPGGDALETCRALRHGAGERTPIVLLMGSAEWDGADSASAAGVDEFLEKPSHPWLVRHRVRSLLARRETPRSDADLDAEALEVVAVDSGPRMLERGELVAALEQELEQARDRDRHVVILSVAAGLEGSSSELSGLLSERAELFIQAIGIRLRNAIADFELVPPPGVQRGDIVVGRMKGAKFAVVVPGLERVEEAARLGQAIQESCTRPLVLDGGESLATISIGLAVTPRDGAQVDELLKRADIAAYCSQRQGSQHAQFYTAAMDRWAFERLTLEHSIRQAVDRGEFVVYYQPRIDLRTERIVGVEALVRWEHPQLGLVPPNQFIPLAESTGLIVPIGEWVLRTACEQNVRWRAAGFHDLRMAVNLSSVQFQRPGLLESVRNILDDSGLDPQGLELELTESMLMQDAQQTVETLKDLKSLGISLSIDDFGTGYSSLSYLRRFPIDALKIDKSFIREVTSNGDDSAIVTSIILMGHSLKLKVVAEGVETKSQLTFLKVLQCDEVQGFLFSKPVPADQLEAQLRA